MTPHAKKVVAVARAPVEEALGPEVALDVEALKTEGDWAFVLASLQDAEGQPFDFTKSPLAGAAKKGLLSKRYAALLRDHEGRWELIAFVIGPTDAAWLAWPHEHGAPESLFALPD